MNCDGINELLSQGEPLTGSAQQHLASCVGCRTMLQALTPPATQPEPQRIGQIQALIATSLTPVRPLPSNPKLVGNLLAVFIAFSLLAAIPVGYKAFHVLNGYEKFAYYGVILVCAAWFAIATVQEMIPGSKHITSPRWSILAATIVLALLVSVLFQDFEMDGFVVHGIPCLALGCVCAILSGALFWIVVRKGVFVSPLAAGAIVGFFAGLAGVAVLALHCPIQNSAHIIVWHLGAMVLAGLGGAILAITKRAASN
jgi:hypothetical protein